MKKHNLLNKVVLCFASFALICPLAMNNLNNQPANARRRARTHRVYRHHRRKHYRHVRTNANIWYKKNYKRLCRRDHTHSVFFARGWNDAHYNDPDHSYNIVYGSEARLNPRYSNNVNYRHGWIISRSWEDNGRAFESYRYQSFWHAIHEFNRGQAYAHRHKIHHDVYTSDDGSNYDPWVSNADNLYAL